MWKKRTDPQKPRTKPTAQRGAWHAVSIATERYACEAARGLMGRRFLAAEAPRIPLPQCTAPEACTCTYRHYNDRRGPPRRKEDVSGLRRRDPGGSDRRVGQCRRVTD